MDGRGRGAADQRRLVPRRRRALREDVPDVRDHDAAQGTRQGARKQDLLSLPREAPRPRAARCSSTPSSRTRSRSCSRLPGGRRLFRYEHNGELVNLGARRLNEYIREHLGEEFTAKDFRTWGGTLVAAIELAERGEAETATEQKRTVAAVMRSVGERLGNTPAVARASYVSPAVVEQYLDGRTIDDFRPRHLRVVRARNSELDPEEQALAQPAALLAHSPCARSRLRFCARFR